MQQHSTEIRQGQRFDFGKNWQSYLQTMTDTKIGLATASLRSTLGLDSLSSKTFLDIGSGSGLSSLAARRLGAKVVSFDFDPKSVQATQLLKEQYYPGDPDWQIYTGSVLDQKFLADLGAFDIVYSWGVLHHTGDMYNALKNILVNLKAESLLVIAIYNDQGWISDYWRLLKKTYCKVPMLRPFIQLLHLPYPFGASVLYRLVTGRLNESRGMSLWHNYLDWLGGYPFEVASTDKMVTFYSAYNLQLQSLISTKRNGCNEFVFRHSS